MTAIRRTIAICAAFLLALYGCVEKTTSTYEGHYSRGFESSGFAACSDQGPRWSLSGDTRAIDAEIEKVREGLPDSLDYGLRQSMDIEVFVRMAGSRTNEVSEGHLGLTQPIFEVSEVLEVRESKDGDCRSKEVGRK